MGGRDRWSVVSVLGRKRNLDLKKKLQLLITWNFFFFFKHLNW